jgi:hypothetical protein
MALSVLMKAVIVLLLGIWILLDSSHCHGRTLFSLQREDVFCLYFKLSGHAMGNQDIEDLCSALGKPIFSPFKPVEMFVNPSIEEMKSRLLKRMREYGNDPIFSWRFVAAPAGARSLRWASEPPEELPHATSFIRSVMAPKGWTQIEEAALSHAVSGRDPLQVTVKTRAKGIERLPEKRIVAQENLRIPIRFVVFDPIEIQVFKTGLHSSAAPRSIALR